MCGSWVCVLKNSKNQNLDKFFNKGKMRASKLFARIINGGPGKYKYSVYPIEFRLQFYLFTVIIV